MYSSFPTLPARGYFLRGDKGPEVKKLQGLLNYVNAGREDLVQPLRIDGEYGILTAEAVKFMQTVHSLQPDAQFGAKSLKASRIDMTPARRAVNWAVAVSMDNSFTYGAGKRAHRSGCYFCEMFEMRQKDYGKSRLVPG